ncbi:AraC family transcriptional regulator [Aquimarina pacifica]|uniref:AraC family transcriptional regulator n=1 Tax=Aquimarina pacifica TaxID=1296415 RepID=UPI0004713A01|nr:AraC family transcriptional regulator [Aquimarina pacifica]
MIRKIHFLLFLYLLNHNISHGLTTTYTTFSTNYQVPEALQDSITKYTELSRTAYREGDLESFKKHCTYVLGIAEEYELKEVQIKSLVYLAIYYQSTGEYEKSLTRYLEAEKLGHSLPENSYSRILVQVNLGNLYNHIEDYENVKISMNKVIELTTHLENPDNVLMSAYNSMGTANLNQGNYSEALSYMLKVKEIAEKTGRNDKIIGALINISECYRYLEQYNNAIRNSKKALERIDEKEAAELEGSANFIMGVSYYLSNQPLKGLKRLKKAKEIATKGGFLSLKMETHEYLAQTYESLDSIKNSLEEQKAYTQTREQYLKTLSKAQRLKLEKESQTKSKIITDQQKSIVFLSKEKQIYLWIGGGLFILLIVSTILYRNRRKRLAKQSLLLEGDKELLKNENELLRDKLNKLAKKIQNQEVSDTIKSSLKNKKTSLTLDEQKEYMDRILEFMEQEKPYLDHEIKQSDIADKLNISVHLFSEVLNVCFQKNFNNFINLYRIDRAKQLMKNPQYANYKILAIGYEAGFPSKTSFNRIFKNLVGLTPSEFQKRNIYTEA